MRLDHKSFDLAGNLPRYGEQRHLEIARASATNPRLLPPLDEPAVGMNPGRDWRIDQTDQLDPGNYHLTILLIQHDMSLVMSIWRADLRAGPHGIVISSGLRCGARHDPRVIYGLGISARRRVMFEIKDLQVSFGENINAPGYLAAGARKARSSRHRRATVPETTTLRTASGPANVPMLGFGPGQM